MVVFLDWMNSLKDFLKNIRENIFGISIKNEDKQLISFIIEDYEFEMNLEKIQLSTKKDILIQICEKVNQMGLKTEVDLLLEFSKIYNVDMGYKKPFYQGKDDLEIEIDQKIILIDEYLPSEIFLHIFEFFKPSDVCQLSRVSKKWLRFTQLEVLWKNFCKREGSNELSEGNSRYIDEYKDLMFFGIPKEVSLPDSFIPMIKEFQKQNLTIGFFHSNHIYLEIIDSKDGIPNQNFIISFILFDNFKNFGSTNQPQFSVRWNGHKCRIFEDGENQDFNYGNIKISDGDIIGADYNKKTGEFSFIHNDTNLGVVHKTTKELDLCITLQLTYKIKLVKGRKTSKKLEFEKPIGIYERFTPL